MFFMEPFNVQCAFNCVYLNHKSKREFRNTSAINTAMTAVANSGAELPAAINVAPATSGWM